MTYINEILQWRVTVRERGVWSSEKQLSSNKIVPPQRQHAHVEHQNLLPPPPPPRGTPESLPSHFQKHRSSIIDRGSWRAWLPHKCTCLGLCKCGEQWWIGSDSSSKSSSRSSEVPHLCLSSSPTSAFATLFSPPPLPPSGPCLWSSFRCTTPRQSRPLLLFLRRCPLESLNIVLSVVALAAMMTVVMIVPWRSWRWVLSFRLVAWFVILFVSVEYDLVFR